MGTAIMLGLRGIGGWFLKNPMIIAVALLSAAFVVVVISKNSEIAGLNKQIFDPKTGYAVRLDGAVQGLAVARANVATLNGTLLTQSQSILALKAQGDASLGKFDTLIAGQASANASTAKKLAALDAAKPGADKCQSAFDLVRSTLQ